MKALQYKYWLPVLGFTIFISSLPFLYNNRWIIRFVLKNQLPCLLWTKKIRSNAQALTIVSKVLPNKPIIIEAGAYDGSDSINLATIWKDGHVHCFEPVPELYATVLENIKKHTNISSYQKALSDKEGTADFYVSSMEKNPNEPSASSSLLAPAHHLTEYAHIRFNKKITIQTTTLDLWAEKNNISHIDFIWLDTQGSELSILKNASKILKTVKAVLTEVEFVESYKNQPLFSDIKTWMESQGFTLEAIHIGCEWSGDALFIRS